MTQSTGESAQEIYLGDGLYASFDGWMIWLRAPREGGDHLVALEPPTYQALQRWIAVHPGLAKHMKG